MIKITLTLDYDNFEDFQSSYWIKVLDEIVHSNKCLEWEYEEDAQV